MIGSKFQKIYATMKMRPYFGQLAVSASLPQRNLSFKLFARSRKIDIWTKTCLYQIMKFSPPCLLPKNVACKTIIKTKYFHIYIKYLSLRSFTFSFHLNLLHMQSIQSHIHGMHTQGIHFLSFVLSQCILIIVKVIASLLRLT